MKNFNWKNQLKRIVLLALFVGLVLVLVGFKFAHADNGSCDVFDFSLSACISSFFYWIIYICGVIAGMFIAIILWVATVILQFNMNIVDTTLVQVGFSVTLGIANLGFVLGIIIVALATILRRDTYGIKSLLWKIVIMAIFVNFALVIAAPILGFANTLTMYFINALPGGSNSLTGTSGTGGSAVQGFSNLAAGIAGIFQPQRLIAPENANISVGSTVQAAVGPLGTTLAGIAGVAMSLVALTLMIVVLIVFTVMLLIRYVYLEVLLIVAPFAWAAWVFPKTSKYWSQWWDKFIAQAFFPVVLMFFLYLIITTGNAIGAGQSIQVTPVSSSWISGFFQALGNGILGPIVGSAVNGFVMVGLMMAGLAMATKLSTEGSKLAAQVVGKVKDSVQGYAAKKGQKARNAVARKTGITKAIENARTGQLGTSLQKKKLFGINVGKPLGAAVQAVSNAPVVNRGLFLASRSLGGEMDNANLVEEAKKYVPKNPVQVKADLEKAPLTKEEVFAYLAQLAKDGELTRNTKVKDMTAEEFFITAQENGDITAYGQGKLASDYDKLTGRDANVRVAEKAVNAGNNDEMVKAAKDVKDEFGNVVYSAGQMVRAIDLLDASYRSMAQTFDKTTAGKIDINQTPKDELKRLVAAFALYSPGLISPLLKKAKAPALDNISTTYEVAINEKINTLPAEIEAEKKAIRANTKLSPDEMAASLASFDARLAAIQRRVALVPPTQPGGVARRGKNHPLNIVAGSMAANVMFGGYDATAGGGGAAPASGAPTP